MAMNDQRRKKLESDDYMYKGCPRGSGTILKFIVLTLNKSKLLKVLIDYYTYLVLHKDKV